jgi:hypothetical protein
MGDTWGRRQFVGALPSIAASRFSEALQQGAVCDVTSFGAVGDGASDDTGAIAAAVEACPPSGRLYFPPAHRYRMGLVEITKNLVVAADGASFSLAGRNAGFAVRGLVDFFRVYGGTFFGSGDPAENQMAWTLGNVPGAVITNVLIDAMATHRCVSGVKVAGTPEEPVTDVTVRNCKFFDSAGVVGGTGNGVSFTHGNYGKAIACHFERCQRHGLYFAEGKHYAAVGNTFRDHRATVSNHTMLAALSISRSDNVTAIGNVFDECHDGTVAIDTDVLGRFCRNVTLTANTFQNSRSLDVVVGNADPAEHGLPRNVLILGNAFLRDPESPVGTLVDVRSASYLTIANNTFLHEATGPGTPTAIYLRASGGDRYTTFVSIQGNTFGLDAAGGAAYSVEIASGIAQGRSVVRVAANLDQSRSGVHADGRITNPNLQIAT